VALHHLPINIDSFQPIHSENFLDKPCAAI